MKNYFWLLNLLWLFLLPSFTTSLFSQNSPFFVKEYFAYHYRDDCFALVTSFSRNPISLSFENRYGVKEMMTKDLLFVPHFKNNYFSLHSEHFGYAKFGTLHCDFGFARSFGNRFSMGMKFYYLLNHAENYPKKHSFTFDFSFTINVNEKFGFFFETYNPACLKYEITGKVAMPTRFNVACFYQINNRLLFTGKLSKTLSEKLNLTVSVFYKRSFWATNFQLSALDAQLGFDFWWKCFGVGITSSYNYFAGFSNVVTLCFYY